MDRPSRRTLAAPLLVIATVALTGCGPGPSASPTAAPSATPSESLPQGSPTAEPAADFNLTVVPASFIGRVIGGTPVVLLVSVDGRPSDGPVSIYSSGATSTEPMQLVPGAVAEIRVTTPACPDECGETLFEVTVRGERGGIRQAETRVLTLVPGTDELEAEARAHLAPFETWLAKNRPELGITAATDWEPMAASWVLVVEHYLFFSTDWELNLEWHVMIAPDDWSRISLRHRGTELAPSLAFQIDSVSGGSTPHEVDPPDAVWR